MRADSMSRDGDRALRSATQLTLDSRKAGSAVEFEAVEILAIIRALKRFAKIPHRVAGRMTGLHSPHIRHGWHYRRIIHRGNFPVDSYSRGKLSTFATRDVTRADA